MTTLPRKRKLLLLWSSYDFAQIYQSSFADHPDFEIELISAEGNETEKAGYRRLWHLRRQVDAGKFDLVIANNIKRSPFPGNKGLGTTASLAARLLTYQHKRLDSWWAPWLVRGGRSRTPLAVIDSRDGHYVYPWDLPLLEASKLFFKRDLMNWPRRALMPLQNFFTEKRIKPHEGKLRPMSMGIEERLVLPTCIPIKDRDYDIFCGGSENSALRRTIREKCEAMSDRYRVFVARDRIPEEEYQDAIRRSKLVVCVESFGAEIWRLHEAIAAGAIPVASWPYTQFHEPLLPDVHAFYFSFMGDHFERTIAEAMRDQDRLQRMSDVVRQFVRAKKLRAGLLNYVVDTTLAEP